MSREREEETVKFLKSLGQYLKESYNNGSDLYSALFVTLATIGIGVSFGAAGILALGSGTAVPLLTAGATAIALGAYAGAPAIAEFSHGIRNALKGKRTLPLKNYDPSHEPVYTHVPVTNNLAKKTHRDILSRTFTQQTNNVSKSFHNDISAVKHSPMTHSPS